MAIKAFEARGKYVGICGQGPSDHADFAEWLVEEGIDSVSLNPDTVVDTWLRLAGAEVGAEANSLPVSTRVPTRGNAWAGHSLLVHVRPEAARPRFHPE